MPTDTSPAAGAGIIAAAQVLDRRNIIVKEGTFGAAAGDANIYNRALRTSTTLYVGNLPEIYISLLQFPEYDRVDFVFQARNYIAWRAVAINPGTLHPAFALLTSDSFVPLTTPQLLPVGEPIFFQLCCAGVETIALEFDTSAEVPAADQGEDRVIVTMSASQ